MRLLIVDDNEEMRRLIVAIVRDLADEIAECADGAEALAGYEEFQPDLVLMDLKMPLQNGIVTSREIIGCFPWAKICVVTDYGDAATREAVRLAGVAHYVTKDSLFDLREIIETQRCETRNPGLMREKLK